MFRLQYIWIFFFIITNLFSQDFDNGRIVQNGYYEEITFELVHDKIIIPVTINGKSYKFLLDTGAPNLVSKRILNELNITASNSAKIQDANNQSSTMETVLIPSITLGSIERKDNLVLITDLENHFILKCYKFDGFIGSNFFKNSILKIDMENKKIIITDDIKKLEKSTKPKKMKLVGSQNTPYIKISFVNDKKKATEELLIDTGMDGFYEMSNRAYGIFSKENIFEELSRSSGSGTIGLFGSTPKKEQVLLKTKGIQINGTTFENLIFNTTDDNNSRLGFDLLKYGSIILDFKNENFYFESDKKITFNKRPPVFTPTIVNNKFAIGFVWDKNLLEQLHFGDEITRIANYRFSEMDFCDILQIKKELENLTSYEMEVKSKDNQTLTLKIEN
jgi:predicted aspartyl protease